MLHSPEMTKNDASDDEEMRAESVRHFFDNYTGTFEDPLGYRPYGRFDLTPVAKLMDDQLFENYLEFLKEYLWLYNEFKASYPDLSRKSKESLARTMGTDDYLFLWESSIFQNMPVYIEERFAGEDDAIVRTRFLNLHDLYVYNHTVDLVVEYLTEIVGEDIHYIRTYTPLGLGSEGPNCIGRFDFSWYAMALYSFRNDRARDILFELAISPEGEQVDKVRRPLADWAVYYLSLLPNTEELLPTIRTLLTEELTQEQTFRLTQLASTLEFNKKIPTEERERFDSVRRELAISWSLWFGKRDRSGSINSFPPHPRMFATLRKGEEHFEIYCLEYNMPGLISTIFLWEGNNDTIDVRRHGWYHELRLIQERKAFYEHELAHPRPNYTERQKEYIEKRVEMAGQ